MGSANNPALKPAPTLISVFCHSSIVVIIARGWIFVAGGPRSGTQGQTPDVAFWSGTVYYDCMKTWNFLVETLKQLEVVVPPQPGTHHAITYAKYGNLVDGWEDRLALQIQNSNKTFTCLFIEEDDLEGSPEELVLNIMIVLFAPDGEPKVA